MKKLALIILTSILTFSSIANAGPIALRMCVEIGNHKFGNCDKAPPNQVCGGNGEYCDATSCWCGDEDAYPGQDETGFPLIARELQELGISCEIRDLDVVMIGQCSDIYTWACDDVSCGDDIGNFWYNR